MVDGVSVRFKNARVEKMPLNIRIQWNAGTACVSECVLKMLVCRDLRVGPSKGGIKGEAKRREVVEEQTRPEGEERGKMREKRGGGKGPESTLEKL